MQTNLFKNTAFEASDDDFQETPLLRKAAKEDTSAPGPSNAVTSVKASIPTVNKDMSAQDVLPAPIPSTSCISAPIKASKKYQDKVNKAEALKKEKKRTRRQAMSKNKYPKFVTLIQEVVDYIIQLVYAVSIFANYYFLELLENGEGLPVVTQSLFYHKFSIFAGQGKHAFDSIKKNFKTFCESTSPTQSNLDKYASMGYITIVSSMAKQYETLVRNYVCSNEDRTLRHILNVLSEKASPYFCGDSLTIKQRKSLAKHIFQQKINTKCAWPSTIDRIERYETIVNSFLTFWSTILPMMLTHQKEMEQKNFIQEMKPQDKASSSYIHRKLQELSFVKKLNTSKYISLKENTLTAINSNKALEITSRLRNIDKKGCRCCSNFYQNSTSNNSRQDLHASQIH
ncbi:hypothetical protein RMATCC62417_14343 [Rhizopus microsporus]|nr:hypothetical protein RMATCC62417_14343 [Rhizopus microsporus]